MECKLTHVAPPFRLNGGSGQINGGGKLRLAHTIKANYYKMGVRNFLFTKDDGFDATGVIFEYA